MTRNASLAVVVACVEALTGCNSASGSTAESRATASLSSNPASSSSASASVPAPAGSGSALPPPPTEEPTSKDVEEHAFVAPTAGFYAVFLPPGYRDPENVKTRYPLVVILHGSGSTELRHGALADDFGREGVIYVAPRAPYPSADAFIEDRQPGFSAWPYFPKAWGNPDSTTFPKNEVDAVNVERLYTTWIAAAMEDARRRYRVAPAPAVVFGHSQGGTFAHRLAVDHPDLVKAYVAVAGWHEIADTDTRPGLALGSHHIAVLILHSEADPVVPVQKSHDLDRYLAANGVDHESLFLPGDSHRVTPPMKAASRRFIRKWCCGEMRGIPR